MFQIIPDTNLDGFEREAEGKGFDTPVFHEQNKKYYTLNSFFILLVWSIVCLPFFFFGGGGGGDSKKGCYPRYHLPLRRFI